MKIKDISGYTLGKNLKFETLYFDYSYDTENDYAGGRLQIGGQDSLNVLNAADVILDNESNLGYFAIGRKVEIIDFSSVRRISLLDESQNIRQTIVEEAQ